MALVFAGCFTPAGNFDGAETLKVSRRIAQNICRVIGAAETVAGAFVTADGEAHPILSSGGDTHVQ